MKYLLRTQEEKNAFKALIKLGEPNGVEVARDENGQICIVYNDDITFSCDDESDSSSVQAARAKRFDKDGFSWFRSIRGGADDDRLKGDAAWKDLLTRVPKDFFKKYPCLIYSNQDVLRDENVEACKRQIKNLVKDVFDIEADVHEVGYEQRKFYGASLCLKLSASGEPVSLVGRIFFTISNDDKSFRVIAKENAKSLTDVITKKTNDASATLSAAEKEEWDEDRMFVYDKIKDFMRSGANLFNYLVFNDEDLEIFNERLANNVQFNGVLSISCTGIDVNLIMKIFVRVPTYRVALKCNSGAKELTAYNFAKLISIDCACGKKLVEYNRVVSDEDGFDVTVDFDDADRPVFFSPGLNDETARQEAIERTFSKHLHRVECSLVHEYAARCEAYVCEDQFVNVLCRDGREETKCSDCPYCETYMTLDGRAYSLDMLGFNGSEIFVKSDEANFCEVCGRTIEQGETLCPLCKKLSVVGDEEDGKEEFAAQKTKYRKYASLLPVTKRAGGKDKRCVEDQEFIVFKTNDIYFVFDKLTGEFTVSGKNLNAEVQDFGEID